MTGESLNITQANLHKLQTLFPDIFSEGKTDIEKLFVFLQTQKFMKSKHL